MLQCSISEVKRFERLKFIVLVFLNVFELIYRYNIVGRDRFNRETIASKDGGFVVRTRREGLCK